MKCSEPVRNVGHSGTFRNGDVGCSKTFAKSRSRFKGERNTVIKEEAI
jgi:hypothetical protein